MMSVWAAAARKPRPQPAHTYCGHEGGLRVYHFTPAELHT